MTQELSLDAIELRAIQQALQRHRGKKPRAAKELGISLKTLYNKLSRIEPHLEPTPERVSVAACECDATKQLIKARESESRLRSQVSELQQKLRKHAEASAIATNSAPCRCVDDPPAIDMPTGGPWRRTDVIPRPPEIDSLSIEELRDLALLWHEQLATMSIASAAVEPDVGERVLREQATRLKVDLNATRKLLQESREEVKRLKQQLRDQREEIVAMGRRAAVAGSHSLPALEGQAVCPFPSEEVGMCVRRVEVAILHQNRHEAVAAIDALFKQPSEDIIDLSSPIVALVALPVRLTNALEESGIDTIGDLVAATPERLQAIPNFGQVSIDKCRAVLAKHGWSQGAEL